MSRINAIRIVNLNYNNNSIHIDDEIFELGTESTLFSLRNGGGKSVLVQMMTAPFVRKRYRDTKDRSFESYFTSNRPTFILVEWALDGDNGYVLTGLMVRKTKENKEENEDPLDTIQFIYEYRERNDYDIYRFPCTKEDENGKKLLSFGQAKQLFEQLKMNLRFQFNFYDMNLPNQFRSYFDKLLEFGINHKEWESIVKKINLKESGLSELFSDARDESGLVDKWFLPAVEDKLSKDVSRIDKFVELIKKYIKQYKENQSNFTKKETIEQFKEETKTLMELAKEYQEKLDLTNVLENNIANLVMLIKNGIDKLSVEQKEVQFVMDEINRKINEIECIAIAYEIYLKEDERKRQQDLLLDCEKILSQMEKEQLELNHKLKQYDCSKAYSVCEETRKEVIEIESKIDLIRRKDEDLTPERNNLGYSMNQYYQGQVIAKREQLKEKEAKIEELATEHNGCIEAIEQYNQLISKNSEESGRLKSNVKAYDVAEAEFNYRYKEDLSRNIVGNYEDGLLAIKEAEIMEKMDELKLQKKELQNQIQAIKTTLEEKEHEKSEAQIAYATEDQKKKQLTARINEIESLIAERKTLLPYVAISEEYIFDTSKILDAFEQKLSTLRESERQYVVLEEKKKRKLEQLKSGKVLELPREMEERLADLDIHYLYGCDWLKNNGKTDVENKQLIKANPFLPYAIIVGEKEFEILLHTDLNVHTSFPLPIIKRAELESIDQDCDGPIYTYTNINFYISFNHSLLDSKGLTQLIALKAKELEECLSHLATLREEIRHYEDKKNIILFHKLNQTEFESLKKSLTRIERQLEDYKKLEENATETVKQLMAQQLLLTKTSENIEYTLAKANEKFETFTRLREQYESYQNDRERLSKLTDEIKSTKSMIDDMKMTTKRLKEKEHELRSQKEYVVLQLHSVEEKERQYASFHEGTLLEQSIEEMEARFTSITQNIYQEESDLQDRLSGAKKRHMKAEEELNTMVLEYGLRPEEYETLSYQLELVLECRKKVSNLDQMKQQKSEEKLKISNEETKLRTEIYTRKADYDKKSGGKEFIARDQITVMNYKDAIQVRNLELLSKQKEYADLAKKLSVCQTVLASLSEYEAFAVTKPLELHVNYSELNSTKNELIKEYRKSQEEVRKCNTAVVQEIARLLRNKSFAEEYYHKPLESLERLVDAPQVLIEQLKTTIAAYDNLLIKLSVDLQLIEREGEKVLEVLLQYIREVHENLGKIDRNSTITIRDRSIKMLKIKLPDWEEEKNTYTVKCKDYLEDLVLRALELLDQNKNIEELVASYITTKNLYHQVVGIGNIGIHLYKIEEEREYPITWAEVSKNSGGEGFLSAFVILSSLLSYMRRDDTDIFHDKDSGKVLIMDNPFAQTNAAHLLKPLMDIAKKSNTQLICLSGLGGESIYNRFENIYVLNLVSSKIKDSMQYLYGEHIKGEELESIVSTRIKVEEEQMVLF